MTDLTKNLTAAVKLSSEVSETVKKLIAEIGRLKEAFEKEYPEYVDDSCFDDCADVAWELKDPFTDEHIGYFAPEWIHDVLEHACNPDIADPWYFNGNYRIAEATIEKHSPEHDKAFSELALVMQINNFLSNADPDSKLPELFAEFDKPLRNFLNKAVLKNELVIKIVEIDNMESTRKAYLTSEML